MKKEIIQQIVSHLNKKGLLSEDVPVTEDEFVEKLYINNDERKEILKALISLFSEDYRSDLQREVSLDNELARIIYELQFVDEAKKFRFALGKCTKEEQQVVYRKMFKALHLVLIAQEYSPNKFSSSLLTENLAKPGFELSASKLKKQPKKKFNLEHAIHNLELARSTLENATQYMDQQKHFFQQISQQQLEVKNQSEEPKPLQSEESKFVELSHAVESFRLMTESRISLQLDCTEESTLPAELGAAVGKLCPVLQFLADSTKISSLEETELRKNVDLEKMIAQAQEMEKNSIVSKCFSKGMSDEEISIHE